MFWDKDDWDESYDDLTRGPHEDDDDEENDTSAMYFDVELPYRPTQTYNFRRNI